MRRAMELWAQAAASRRVRAGRSVLGRGVWMVVLLLRKI